MAALLAKYNTALDLYFPLIKRGVMDYAVSADYTHASGDVKISKDGGAAATATNAPSAITMGNGAMWKLTLTATEMQAAQIVVTVVDAATKAIEDQMIIIQTYGNASAQHPFDLATATQSVSVTQWNGTNVASPATAGIPEVNVKNINNVAASSVTAINANIGTTQPVNFTGTGASALVKSDMVDVAGAAVSTSSAQIGVNAVNIGGTTQTGRDIGASVLLSAGTGTGQLDFTSGVVKANLAQILGTALTETAGQIAAAFKQFFNIASPTSTMNLITTVTTTTNLTNAPVDSSGVTTLLSRLSATRAGYLDNLSGGAVALASKLQKYVQLLARKDSAIATDNATEVSEINANGGSGAGAYANTTDALEALSDTALKPTVAGRTLDVSATGEAGIDWANVGSPTTVVGLSGTTVKTATDVEADTQDIQGRLPAALVSGRMDSNVQAMATGVITATAIAADAIGASELAADAVAEIADQVWDEVLSGHLTGGSTGNALNSAGSAGDPWGTAVPGAYSPGSAGYIVGNRLDAAVSSRLASASYTAPDNTGIAAVQAKTDLLNFTGTDVKATLDGETVTPANGSITAAVIATDAIDGDAIAASAVAEIQAGLSTYAGGDTPGTTTLLTRIPGTVQPQTGDSYARLGTPAGASVSADIAAVKAETASIQTDTNDIQTRLPAALTGAGNMKTDALAINGSTSAAAQLGKSAIGIVSGSAVTGTLSTTQMSTDLTEATNDHYKDLVLKWTSGALLGQATSISAYNGSTKVLTFTAVTDAPANGDTFVIM